MDSPYWDWRTKGSCAGLSTKELDKLFFPESGRSIIKAKEFCKDCPVLVNCLQFALDNTLEGIWAGTTYADRLRMIQARRKINGYVPPVRKPKVVARRNLVFT